MPSFVLALLGFIKDDGGRLPLFLVLVAAAWFFLEEHEKFTRKQVDKLSAVVEQNSSSFITLHSLLLDRTSDRYTSRDANADWRTQQEINRDMINKLNDHEVRLSLIERKGSAANDVAK